MLTVEGFHLLSGSVEGGVFSQDKEVLLLQPDRVVSIRFPLARVPFHGAKHTHSGSLAILIAAFMTSRAAVSPTGSLPVPASEAYHFSRFHGTMSP